MMHLVYEHSESRVIYMVFTLQMDSLWNLEFSPFASVQYVEFWHIGLTGFFFFFLYAQMQQGGYMVWEFMTMKFVEMVV